MGYRCWAERFVTADFSGSPVHSQKIQFTNGMFLKAIRSMFVVYNSPSMTAMTMRIYSDVSGSLGTLLHTAETSWTRAQITSSSHGAREIYFDFTNAISLLPDTTYHFVPWVTGYTGDSSAHIAWVKAFPDPTYETGLTINQIKIATLPYKIAFIGDEV